MTLQIDEQAGDVLRVKVHHDLISVPGSDEFSVIGQHVESAQDEDLNSQFDWLGRARWHSKSTYCKEDRGRNRRQEGKTRENHLDNSIDDKL